MRKALLLENIQTEKRKDTRTALASVFRYRFSKGENAWKPGRSIDISRGGMRVFIKDDDIRIGSQIELEVALPEMPELYQVQGTVVWRVLRTESQRKLECGISFKDSEKISQKEKLSQFLADKLCRLALHSTAGLITRPVASLEEIKTVSHLLYKEYSKRGYCPIDASQMHYSGFGLLPDSRTFLIENENKKVLGTISLIPDSICGLPIESIFPEEIAGLRSPGRKLAEVGLLALDQELFGKHMFSLTNFQKQACLFRLFKMMSDDARFRAETTDLIIGIHPKHAAIYQYLAFEAIGPVRSYPGACEKPALLMRLEYRKFIQGVSQKRSIWRYFIGQNLPKELLNSQFQWDRNMLEEFLSEAHAVREKIPVHVRDFLLSCYPAI